MTRRLPRLLWLVVVWIALWEDLSAANILAGLAVGTVLVTAFPPRQHREVVVLRPLATARFLGYFIWKLAEASAIVAWEVVTPRNRINEGIVAVPLYSDSATVTTIVANAISLTPGTLTVEVHRQPSVLYVHVLHLRDIEAVRLEAQRLEVLALRAFGRREAAVELAAALPGGTGR